MKKRTRIVLVGCGDVALRVARRLHGRYLIYGLARSAAQAEILRAAGVRPIRGDLDDRRSLLRLALGAHAVLHFAPPASETPGDPRTRFLLAAMASKTKTSQHWVYISTSGVYGDHGGAWVRESSLQKPQSERAQRRQAAENLLRRGCRRFGARLAILRAPGIYADNRLPLDRLRAGTPVLRTDEDVFTNHVHADDLARATIAAMWLGRGGRAYNASDDAAWRMGEWFDRLADAASLPRPPRIARAVASQHLSAIQLSFMSESRRLMNTRLKRELRFRFSHPTPEQLLARLANTPGFPIIDERS